MHSTARCYIRTKARERLFERRGRIKNIFLLSLVEGGLVEKSSHFQEWRNGSAQKGKRYLGALLISLPRSRQERNGLASLSTFRLQMLEWRRKFKLFISGGSGTNRGLRKCVVVGLAHYNCFPVTTTLHEYVLYTIFLILASYINKESLQISSPGTLMCSSSYCLTSLAAWTELGGRD